MKRNLYGITKGISLLLATLMFVSVFAASVVSLFGSENAGTQASENDVYKYKDCLDDFGTHHLDMDKDVDSGAYISSTGFTLGNGLWTYEYWDSEANDGAGEFLPMTAYFAEPQDGWAHGGWRDFYTADAQSALKSNGKTTYCSVGGSGNRLHPGDTAGVVITFIAPLTGTVSYDLSLYLFGGVNRSSAREMGNVLALYLNDTRVWPAADEADCVVYSDTATYAKPYEVSVSSIEVKEGDRVRFVVSTNNTKNWSAGTMLLDYPVVSYRGEGDSSTPDTNPEEGEDSSTPDTNPEEGDASSTPGTDSYFYKMQNCLNEFGTHHTSITQDHDTGAYINNAGFTMGNGLWTYEYWDPEANNGVGEFKPMTAYFAERQTDWAHGGWNQFYTADAPSALSKNYKTFCSFMNGGQYIHPGATAGAVVTFLVPKTGTISYDLSIFLYGGSLRDSASGNGDILSLYVNDTRVWPAAGEEDCVIYSDTATSSAPYKVSVPSIEVTAGDKVRFMVSTNTENNNGAGAKFVNFPVVSYPGEGDSSTPDTNPEEGKDPSSPGTAPENSYFYKMQNCLNEFGTHHTSITQDPDTGAYINNAGFTMGNGLWTYEYWDPEANNGNGEFKPMSAYFAESQTNWVHGGWSNFYTADVQSAFVKNYTTFCSVGGNGQRLHPGDTAGVVVTFVAPCTGTISYDLSIYLFGGSDRNSASGRGDVLSLYVNDTRVWPAAGEEDCVIYSDTATSSDPYKVSVPALEVKAGDKIRFMVTTNNGKNSAAGAMFVNLPAVSYLGGDDSSTPDTKPEEGGDSSTPDDPYTYRMENYIDEFGTHRISMVKDGNTGAYINSDGFVMGDGLWTYEYWDSEANNDNGEFKPMTAYFAERQAGWVHGSWSNFYTADAQSAFVKNYRTYCSIGDNGKRLHPGDTAGVVVTFVAPYTGTVSYDLSIYPYGGSYRNLASGIGDVLSLYVNDTRVWPAAGEEDCVVYTDTATSSNPYEVSVPSIDVKAGDKVRFMVTTSNGDNRSAGAEFVDLPVVSYLSAPSDENPEPEVPTVSDDGIFKEVNVSLGEDLSINYYLKYTGSSVPKIRFTFNGRRIVVDGEYDEKKGLFRYKFSHIGPHMIGVPIFAEVIIDNGITVKVLASKEYTVLEYLNALLAKEKGVFLDADYSQEKYDNMILLIKDLICYGGAAQYYTGDNLHDPINRDFVTGSSDPLPEREDIEIKPGKNIQFNGAKVLFGGDNKLVFRFSAKDLTGVTFTYTNGGDVVTVNNADIERDGDYYTFKTQGIKAIRFGERCTVTAYGADGTELAYVKYSVNDYALAKQNSPGELASLATATYYYGESAKKFHSPD